MAAARVYADHGLTGANRGRPGLREALAAGRAGDTLVVTKLDRLARSLPDARDIVEELTQRTVASPSVGCCSRPAAHEGGHDPGGVPTAPAGGPVGEGPDGPDKGGGWCG